MSDPISWDSIALEFHLKMMTHAWLDIPFRFLSNIIDQQLHSQKTNKTKTKTKTRR